MFISPQVTTGVSKATDHFSDVFWGCLECLHTRKMIKLLILEESFFNVLLIYTIVP